MVAALGDSISAGLGSGAKSIVELMNEYRGKSWSMGGDYDLSRSVTLPNLLRQFNPNLKGFSLGTDSCRDTTKGKGLNVATSGHQSSHIPEQAKLLVERLKASRAVDFANDWKMVTMFVGGNDLCRYCKSKQFYTPGSYINSIRQGLDILYEQVPRVFVNLVTIFNVSEMKHLNKGLLCSTLHHFVCDCAAFPKSTEQEIELKNLYKNYQQLTEELVASDRYKQKREDFAVVIQPFMKNLELPKKANGQIDFTYFAPDCYHLSLKGHALAAIALWNNMFQPTASKAMSWTLNSKPICPSESQPYLLT